MSSDTNASQLKLLGETVASLIYKSSGVKDALLRRVIFPKLTQDTEFAIDFITKESLLFLVCFELNLLKECDFSDLVLSLAKKNYTRPLGLLASVAKGFNLSDEAAWILMEKVEANKAAKIDNIFHSIWFRKFTDDTVWDSYTVARFKNALDKASNIRVALGDTYDRRYHALGTARFTEGILNFQLNEPWSKYSDFNTYRLIINDTFLNKTSLVGVEKDILNWALPLFDVEKAHKLSRILYPVILYSDDINNSVKELYREQITKLIPEVGSIKIHTILPRKWHSVLTPKEITSFLNDYPNLCDSFSSPIVRHDSLWNMSTDQFIEDFLNSNLHNLLPAAERKTFTLLMARSLRQEFNVQVDAFSFSQVLSIYKATTGGEFLV